MSSFDSGGFDAPPPGGRPTLRQAQQGVQLYQQASQTAASAHAQLQRFASRGAPSNTRPTPPAWTPDASVRECMSSGCSTHFETFERRHHCRYCGQVFCGKCSVRYMLMPPVWDSLVAREYSIRDPQRVCAPCAFSLEQHQEQWATANANAHRTNSVVFDDYVTRYMNSPVRFTLGGEVRKAAYSLRNLSDGVNFWERDSDYFDQQLSGADGLLFLTVGTIAFLGGLRFGTGLLVARLPSGGWSAPCAVATVGLSFGAAVGAVVTDMIMPVDSRCIEEFANANTSKVSLGGEVSFALGPLGRTASGGAILATDASTSSSTAYSQSRGFYGGITVDAASISVRQDVNQKFYGKPTTALDLLHGVTPPPNAAGPLYEQLDAFYAMLSQRQQQVSNGNDAAGYAQPGQNPYQPQQQQFQQPPPPQQRYQQPPQQPRDTSARTGSGVGDSLFGRPAPSNPFDSSPDDAQGVVEV